MKTLDIFEGKNKINAKFDEMMYSNGIWYTCNLDFDVNHIVKLHIRSDVYYYFLYQDNLGEHFILRNKK